MHWLTAYRKAHGHTQEQMAALLGVSQATISMWEIGEREVGTPDMIHKIHEVTGIPKEVISPKWYGVGTKKPPSERANASA